MDRKHPQRDKPSRVQSETVRRAVGSAFADAQRSYATHARASRALLAAFQKSPEAFLDAFVHCLNRALVVFSREPAVERIISFVAAFAAENSATDEQCQDGDPVSGHGKDANPTPRTGNFSSLVLHYLMDQTTAASKAVRFRTCQTLAAALNALPENAALDDNLWDSLQDALLERATDKVPRVRAAAAAALCRLQTSGVLEEDPVASMLLSMLSTDSSSAVRKAALTAVAVSDATIGPILRRTRDVKEDVRKAAYGVLAAKIHPADLPEDDRIETLRNGLRDRSRSVRAVCGEDLLVNGWLEGACESNVFRLVELLGGNINEDDTLLALRVVFASPKRDALLDAILVDVNNMKADDVLILRAMCDVPNGAKRFEEIFPTTLTYANTLQYYSVDEFASRNLLAMSKRVDMSDEVGRRALEGIIRTCFLSCREAPHTLMPYAVRAMRRVMVDDLAATRLLLEVLLGDILKSDTDAHDLGDGHEDGTGNERDDADQWMIQRSLVLCREVLISHGRPSSAAQDGNLFLPCMQMAILPRLSSPDSNVREKALECLALYCLLDSSGSQARQNLPLFIQAARNDVDEVKVMALKAIADFFMSLDFSTDAETCHTQAETPLRAKQLSNAHDTDRQPLNDKRSSLVASPGFSESDESEYFSAHNSPSTGDQQVTPGRLCSGKELSQVAVELLCECVQYPDDQTRAIASESLAKLVFSRRIHPTAKLLSLLLLAYYNPVNDDNQPLKQALSVFFPALAYSAPHHRIALESAFMPTLSVLLRAPKQSPLRGIAPLAVAQFMLHLTNPSVAPPMSERASKNNRTDAENDSTNSASLVHERIAESLLHHILDDDDDFDNSSLRLYTRVLAAIRLAQTNENSDELCRIRKLTARVAASVDDKIAAGAVARFQRSLPALATGIDRATEVM